jgi:hypothetical protein
MAHRTEGICAERIATPEIYQLSVVTAPGGIVNRNDWPADRTANVPSSLPEIATMSSVDPSVLDASPTFRSGCQPDPSVPDASPTLRTGWRLSGVKVVA